MLIWHVRFRSTIYPECNSPLGVDDAALLKHYADKFHKPSAPIEDMIIPNQLLESHPMMQPVWLRKGMRNRPSIKGLRQFKEIYLKMQQERPDEACWSWPPDFAHIDSAEFWGLPDGATICSACVDVCLTQPILFVSELL